MDFAIGPPEPTVLPISGVGTMFPVRRVYCIGQNYAEHAREMGSDPDRAPPFFFQKNPQNLFHGKEFPFPAQSENVHFEIELIVALKAGGVDLSTRDARETILAYGVGLDMTRRDLQAAAKAAGRPWEVAKAFERSGPCSALVTADEIGHPSSGLIWLDCNGARVQTGDLAQMIWSIEEQIVELSRFFRLEAGDVVMTGTPAGVGPVARGDVLVGGVEGVGEISVTVV